MVKLKTLLTEGIETAQEFVPMIEKTIKKHFPKSFIAVSFKNHLTSHIGITFTVGSKSDWSNGIWQNDISATSMIIFNFEESGDIKNKLQLDPNMAGSFLVKPDEGSYMAYGRVKVPIRKKTGTPEQILKSIDKYFSDLKKALKANKDKFHPDHEYVKKYI